MAVEIIRSFSDRLAWWVSEKDRGQTDAINKGFAHANGEILAWLNSDDTYQPHAITEAVRFLMNRPEVGLVYGDANFIDENGRVIGRFPAARPITAGCGRAMCIFPSRPPSGVRTYGAKSLRLTRRSILPWIMICGCAWRPWPRCSIHRACGQIFACTPRGKPSGG